jgi:hypothetical protein
VFDAVMTDDRREVAVCGRLVLNRQGASEKESDHKHCRSYISPSTYLPQAIFYSMLSA